MKQRLQIAEEADLISACQHPVIDSYFYHEHASNCLLLYLKVKIMKVLKENIELV